MSVVCHEQQATSEWTSGRYWYCRHWVVLEIHFPFQSVVLQHCNNWFYQTFATCNIWCFFFHPVFDLSSFRISPLRFGSSLRSWWLRSTCLTTRQMTYAKVKLVHCNEKWPSLQFERPISRCTSKALFFGMNEGKCTILRDHNSIPNLCFVGSVQPLTPSWNRCEN